MSTNDPGEAESPLDRAAADGPIQWPSDPEGDPTDTPVVVLGADEEPVSTYSPFPDSSLEGPR